MLRSPYLFDIFNKHKYPDIITKAVYDLTAFDNGANEFDTIVFRGQSGAALGYPLGLILDKEIVCIRKESDNAHSSRTVEGEHTPKSYIIVDELGLIQTFKTYVEAIDYAIENVQDWQIFMVVGNKLFPV